eukprot:CAMPEP_0114385844 /NCGR_PEP_ID=MMETSP0102-20121206/6268_1 /TAXON_ID=38822 ORGANISM="Pteridomonas danica, Strain PT" /NCGR_SAMPLE_ID=MMETSP0102 /ASSEMBLY_ACC=CAM_ASM_000212 /LENGTH=3026 /DNA_ID=CAMNT_0001542557 /DNA_START=949 /DNA_END=10026 /DNA_ORIENTATION=-
MSPSTYSLPSLLNNSKFTLNDNSNGNNNGSNNGINNNNSSSDDNGGSGGGGGGMSTPAMIALKEELLEKRKEYSHLLLKEASEDYARNMAAIVLRAQGAAHVPGFQELVGFGGGGGETTTSANNNNNNNKLNNSIMVQGGGGIIGRPRPRDMPQIDIHSIHANFDLVTSLNISEAVNALQQAALKTFNICRMRSFFLDRDPRRSQTLSEFHDAQERHMDDEILVLRQWPYDVCDAVRLALKPVSKGWFNVNETRIEAYLAGPLRRQLKETGFIMQVELTQFVCRCARELLSSIEKACEGDTLIIRKNMIEILLYPKYQSIARKYIKELNSVSDYLLVNEKEDMIKNGMSEWPDELLEAKRQNDLLSLERIPPFFTLKLKVLKVAATSSSDGNNNDGGEQGTQSGGGSGGGEGEGTGEVFQVVCEDQPELFVEAVDRLLDVIGTIAGIHQVEKLVMKKLKWTDDPLLSPLPESTEVVEECRLKCKQLLNVEVEKLKEYTKLYRCYDDLLNLDQESYLDQCCYPALSSPEHPGSTLQSLKASGVDITLDPSLVATKLQYHYDAITSLKTDIPNKKVRLSVFAIDPSPVKTHLLSIHSDIVSGLLNRIRFALDQKSTQQLTKYQLLFKKLDHDCINVEEVSELEEICNLLPQTMAEFDSETAFIEEHWNVLDSFHLIPTNPKILHTRHDLLYSNPIKVWNKNEILSVGLGAKRDEFKEEMHGEQEQFEANLLDLSNEVDSLSAYSDPNKLKNIQVHLKSIQAHIEESNEKSLKFMSRQQLFGESVIDYPLLQSLTKNFQPFLDLWTCIANWDKVKDEWLQNPISELDAEAIEKEANNMFKTLNKVCKNFELQTKNGPNDMQAQSDLANKYKKDVDEFRPVLPLLISLRTPGMEDRHWETLSERVGKKVVPDNNFTLTTAKNLKLHEQIDVINKVSETAAKEYAIKVQLDKMAQDWESVELAIVDYRNTETYILTDVDTYIALLDEQVTLTQAMTFSAFKGPYAERIDKWNEALQNTSEVIEEWLKVQRSWMYLQPIFDSPDINKQLPTEGKRFSAVDKHWRVMMKAGLKKPKAIEFCNDAKLLSKLNESNGLLDQVSKGLSDYLEAKRAGYSRFYFLADEELLEILSETKDPLAVQPHLRKCFEAIQSVHFEKDLTITAMFSPEQESIQFESPVDPKNRNIEQWMGELTTQMRVSVRKQMLEGIREYFIVPRTDWMQKWPGMVVINGSQVHWTKETETAMLENGNKGVKEYYDKCVSQLNDMVFLIRGKLSKLARKSVGALAVVDVHARDVMLMMSNSGVDNPNDFDWISQMRYYWKPTDPNTGELSETGDLKVVMVSSEQFYGYEYLGNSMRLVITPLTDKCYLTIMGALQMILGGAPAGPAGTGKTETTKDLAKALAKQCVVFNCSDQLDYRAMGKFFKGLASSGAWACFDEFNRISIEVLSVIAQQVMTLQGCVQRGDTRVIFEDVDIYVDPNFSVYITMNPGYAGRSALPDNLEALFRPVAMMVPDYAMIGEIMFLSYGYLQNRKCGKKMVATFRLCSEQLSSQDHYDYGMRAVKTVIVAAGNLKRAAPDEDEEALLLRALQDVNVPKFLAHDLPLFAGILSDLFPGINRPPFDYGPLLRAIKVSIEAQNLQTVPIFSVKVIELYEMICVRHGLMVVGPTGGGKSKAIWTLKMALSQLKREGIVGERYEKTEIYHCNPKSITMGQLYGAFDPNTNEWQDGILAGLMRAAIKHPDADVLKWMLIDGPVDAIWIENMNTVLDDNKKLCLTSGEIMGLTDTMTMMFEPEDLAVASPATVSRCGMIYMEPKSLGFDPLLLSWLATLPEKAFDEESKSILMNLFEIYVTGALGNLRRNLQEPLPSVDGGLVAGLMNIFESLTVEFVEKEGIEPPTKERLSGLKDHLSDIFIFSLIWSIMITSNDDGRKWWSSYLRMEMDQHGTSCGLKDTQGRIFDFMFDTSTWTWVGWRDTVDAYVLDPNLPYSEIIVPTKDSISYNFFLRTLVSNGKHVLMTGPTGTGKSVNVAGQLQEGFDDTFLPLTLTFSAQTSANQTQDLIDSKCEKRRKGVFGPQAGKRFILFIDDVNMPQKEEYGAQPPLEILRQWFDSGGWYDRKELSFRRLIDLIFVCACGPPGGGRNHVSARFYRHFNIIGCTQMQTESMDLIFATIFDKFLTKFTNATDDLSILCQPLVAASIDVYLVMLEEMRPTPAKSHYQFNLRDLSKIFQGILMIEPKKIETQDQIARAWVHECRRIFCDRLINDEDRNWFHNMVREKLVTHAKLSWDMVCTHKVHEHDLVDGDGSSVDGNGGQNEEAMKKKLMEKQKQAEVHGAPSDEMIIFCDYLIPGADPRLYEEVGDPSELQGLIEEYLSEYNSESKQPMYLVLFMDAIEHVSRISRVLRQPQGNALLLGVGGSGRKSLTMLSTFMADYTLYTIQIAKGYGKNEWRENVKECLLMAGLQDKPIVFLFDDTQIVFESMTEDVNSILNSGDVPNLYAAEDLDAIAQACKEDCIRKRLPQTKLNLFNIYLARVKRNIHVCLTMSPVGEAFRERLRKFPSIVNCCTIDWFSAWPDEALQSVATRAFEDSDLNLGDHTSSVVTVCKGVHQSVSKLSLVYLSELQRYNYVTPTSYLELLSTYRKVLGSKRIEVGTLKDRLQNGLDKLISTGQVVSVLQADITALKPVLVKTVAEVEVMIVNIDKDKADAAITQAQVEKEETAAKEKAASTQAIADDAQKDLDEALPALAAAVQCLKDLKKADIDEVKVMGKPPAGVRLCMEAVCIMFAIPPEKVADPDIPGKKINDYFKSAKNHLLGKAEKLLSDMQDYDKDNIPDKIIRQIKPHIEDPNFTPQAIEKASKACKAMCMWVRAMDTYHRVVLVVEPKKVLLKEAQESLEVTMAALKVAQDTLAGVMTKIARLEAEFKEANDKKESLEKQMEEATGRLERAEVLTDSLGSESVRWTESCKRLSLEYGDLVGDSLIAASTIAYAGAFTPDFRKKLVESWREMLLKNGIPHSNGCDMRHTLADQVVLRNW